LDFPPECCGKLCIGSRINNDISEVQQICLDPLRSVLSNVIQSLLSTAMARYKSHRHRKRADYSLLKGSQRKPNVYVGL
jgi:hypothetical protein